MTEYVRNKVTRGSAAGSALAGFPLHIFDGYDSRMVPTTACGLTIDGRGDYLMRSTTQGEHVCADCTRED